MPHLNHQMKILTPGASSTVDCPPVIGGLGTYSGQVLYAELEIEVFYSQSWWPFAQSERFPFLSKRDVDLHRSPELAMHEQQTAAKLAERMKALGYEMTTGVGGTGIVAVLRTGTAPRYSCAPTWTPYRSKK